jgi:hypothetical protein
MHCGLFAQPYQNPVLPAEDRAGYLVARIAPDTPAK